MPQRHSTYARRNTDRYMNPIRRFPMPSDITATTTAAMIHGIAEEGGRDGGSLVSAGVRGTSCGSIECSVVDIAPAKERSESRAFLCGFVCVGERPIKTPFVRAIRLERVRCCLQHSHARPLDTRSSRSCPYICFCTQDGMALGVRMRPVLALVLLLAVHCVAPRTFRTFGNNCYEHRSESMSWSLANSSSQGYFCCNVAGHLVTLANASENAAVGLNGAWIAATDSAQGTL